MAQTGARGARPACRRARLLHCRRSAQQCRFPGRALPRAMSFAKASSTPASSTAILLRSVPRRRPSIAPPLRSACRSCWSSARARASRYRPSANRTSRRLPGTAPMAFSLPGTRRLALPILADGEDEVAQIAYGAGGPAVTVDGVAPATDAVAVEAGDAVYVLRQGRQTKVSLARSHPRRGWGSRRRADLCARRCMARCSAFWWQSGRQRRPAVNVSPSSRR